MNSWEALIKWFAIVKNNAGVRVDDNFKIESGVVSIDGENLQLHMSKFWLQEGLYSEEEYQMLDLSDMNRRMRIKSHLVNFLGTPYSY